MKNKTVIIVALVIVIVILAVILLSPGKKQKKETAKSESEEVLVLAGGSARVIVEQVVERYKQVSTDKVVPTYGDSGAICAQLQNVTNKGDILVVHDPFMDWAVKKGVIEKWDKMGYVDIVIVVPKGNPRGIREFKDLAQPGLRVGIGNQTYATSGVMVREMLKKLDYGEAIQKNVALESKGHQERCTAVILGSLDAAIVWSVIANLFKDKLDIIPIPRELYVDSVTSATYGVSDLKNVKFTVGLTKVGARKKSAVEFYNFFVKQLDIFEKSGLRMNPY